MKTRFDYIYVSALIVQHCAIDGRLETPVRAYHIGQPAPYAQYPTSVCLSFIRPRKRIGASYILLPDSLRYATVEVDGKIIYDTRHEVPCDMAKWEVTNAEWRERGGSLRIIRSRAVPDGMIVPDAVTGA